MGYTNAALMRFATIPKVHTIAYAIMDSRETDGNVKVGVGSLNNYAIKKKLTFANHAQRNGNLRGDLCKSGPGHFASEKSFPSNFTQ